MATLQFLGATGTVTGSKYLLEVGGSLTMIDCGLFQGDDELLKRNWEPLPVRPASVDRALLTHAHIDHSGYLPRLVRDGFRGPVYASPATADLLRMLLLDAAEIEEEEVEETDRYGRSIYHPPQKLFTKDDVYAALKRVVKVGYHEELELNRFLRVRFIPEGHILGATFIEAKLNEAGHAPIKVLFSGDLGRYHEPVLKDPPHMDETDYLVVESTYGDRLHDPTDPKDRLAEIINATVARGGKIVIPAFAVGRTQTLLWYLRELEEEGRIPILPVTVDSPMAAQATRLYLTHIEDHDLKMRLVEQKNRDPLATRRFQLAREWEESRALDEQRGPAIIIAASGMATGGRVLRHLSLYLPDEASAIILVGFQAAGTRGRRLLEGVKQIEIHGELVPVKATVEHLGNLSGHADRADILRWLSGFKRPPRMTFITHGEPEASEALLKKIVSALGWNAMIPRYGQRVELI
jgi:metallo-beta-lactamase family protein